MPRTIILRILPADVTAVAELEEQMAPETCDLIWEKLPVKGQIGHGRYSGPEFFIQPGDWGNVQPENQIHLPHPGDVGYFHIKPGLFAVSPEGECEVVVIYDHDAEFRGPEGQPVWVNRFARIKSEGSEAFFEVAKTLRTSAPMSLQIERGDDLDV